jgi:D-cysteine desulfhydrase family pyridoxal phosphate-dependent enzyme
MTSAELCDRLARFPRLSLVGAPTPIETLDRVRDALGGGPRLLIKRDDAIAFAFGGNKIRKLEFVAARAQQEAADTLITAGGVQSNHARATAAVAARLGMRAVLVANGVAPERPTANALLDRLLGADVVYVGSREDRAPAMAQIADRLRAEGRRPFVIPIGASTPLGALGYVGAVAELVGQIAPPDVIVHSTSSGGTQAGIVAGCRLLGLATRVIGISADEPAAALRAEIAAIVDGIGDRLSIAGPERAALHAAIEVDVRFVGGGYGIPTTASIEAIDLLARRHAIFLDPTYTAKAMAGLIDYVRGQKLDAAQTALFWHTGGQVGLFA